MYACEEEIMKAQDKQVLHQCRQLCKTDKLSEGGNKQNATQHSRLDLGICREHLGSHPGVGVAHIRV